MEDMLRGFVPALVIYSACIFTAGVATGAWLIPWLLAHVHVAVG